MTRLPLEYLTTYDADDFFADHAPCVREFHCPELNYSLFSSWIPQLHSITVTYPLSLGDLFSLLAITPLLESLKVGQTVLDLLDTENQTRRIHLPTLKRIDLENRFLPCLSILEQVTPSPQCTLFLTITHEELRDLTGAELDRLKAILVQYSQGQPNLKRMESLCLHVGPRKLSIFAPSRTLYPQMIFRIKILSRFNLPSDFFPSILSTFSSCNFLPVTVLEFIVFPGFSSKIASFLLSLPSIEILHVNDDALRLFLDLIESHPGALPLLHTLIWEGTVFEKVNDCAAIDQYLLPILESRKCNEAPIKILDLVKCELKNANELKYFDRMSGMKHLVRAKKT
ncbi:hypothetical protein GALMADRAFT_208450 [Galerina marginata CBS 339.88]|uniref:F-box domain-containing protein n=1 Tax=Galerina marginata (strain CBS 339.88) TaxID=685588 RepID=A0A067TN03_GALM3|nr:hypothetical protein GALMADRAFT_208450 [Galerina marginata CBS 339.88]